MLTYGSNNNNNKLCAWRHNMPPPLSSPVARRLADNVEYVPTLTVAAALRVKAALSKAAWRP